MAKRLLLLLVTSWLALAAVSSKAQTLYDDLGGHDGVHALVDAAVQRWLADPRIASTFSETNMDRLRRLLLEQFCQISDGPCHYTGKDMASSHRALGLNRAQFDALAEDLQATMAELGVGFHTQNRLIAKLAPMERDVVTQ